MPPTARNLFRAQPSGASTPDATIEHLYETEGPRLLRYFQRRTRNSHAAPDLVQDVFVRLASADPMPDLVNPAAYLHRIAQNLLVDRARRPPACEVFVPLQEWDAETSANQEDDLLARDMLRRYEATLAALPERTRMVFLLHRADDLTYPEIAKRLGITFWTVQYHMKRALMHLDRMLTQDD